MVSRSRGGVWGWVDAQDVGSECGVRQECGVVGDEDQVERNSPMTSTGWKMEKLIDAGKFADGMAWGQ
jgi:hypothetical protein